MDFVERFHTFRHFTDAIGRAMDNAAEFAQAFNPGEMKSAKMNGHRRGQENLWSVRIHSEISLQPAPRIGSGEREGLATMRLRSRIDRDVIGSGVFHFSADDFAGELGPIAIAAQMTQINVAKISVDDGLQRFSGGFIGKMPVAAGNALLQAPWTAWILLQHLQIVIRFENENVGGAHSFADKARGMAEVSEKTNFMSAGMQHEADRIIRVMWD
jgi:hypothetical protein